MNKELLQKAIDGLELNDVFIQHSVSFLTPNFDPKIYQNLAEMPLSLLHRVLRSKILELDSDQDPVRNLFLVEIEFGARWHFEAEDTEETFEENTAAKIETIFVVEYQIQDDIPQSALAEFALNNVSYHAWPFWREYLMSQCSRMNLPKNALPMRQVASHAGQSINTDDS